MSISTPVAFVTFQLRRANGAVLAGSLQLIVEGTANEVTPASVFAGGDGAVEGSMVGASEAAGESTANGDAMGAADWSTVGGVDPAASVGSPAAVAVAAASPPGPLPRSITTTMARTTTTVSRAPIAPNSHGLR